MKRRQLYISTAKAALFAGVASTLDFSKGIAQSVGTAVARVTGGVITGKLGTPGATINIDGKQLPPNPMPFGGVITENATTSKTWWAPRVAPPQGAPNILLIMTDDQGYGVSGTFGGVIPTPALDRVADTGLRYTQFHSTSLCSPSRAALITGRNHHPVGFGVITEVSTGFPGYNSIIGAENATVGNILGGHGYATSWFGKNHNTPAFQYSAAGPFDQWPSGMGFDYFYGFLGGETDQWTPYLFQDHTQIFPWLNNPKYNLTTDTSDEAIKYMRQINAAAPNNPFFLYYAASGTHSPHQPTQEWIDKFKGKFDMGWNNLRDIIFANQKRLGVIPQDAKLTEWPDSLPQWDTLDADAKKLFARQAEVYAAYAAYTDYEIGRVIQEVEDQGKLDNTLIIYICGDNGTSPEGTLVGTPNQFTSYNGILDIPIADQMKFYDLWGSAETYPHMAVAWSWAFDTPFQWTKQIASHFGGTRQGMAMSWPARIKDAGGIRSQFHHIIDIMPTLLEATGITAPEEYRGIKQKPIEGVSMVYTWDQANEKAPSTRKVQYFEMLANRGIYDEGWYACTTPPHGPWILNAPLPKPDDYAWELYNLNEDFTQANDLAKQMPDKLKQMQGVFHEEAQKYQVYPLNNDTFARAVAPRPSNIAGMNVFTYTGPVVGIPTGDAPSYIGKSFKITAEVVVGADGGNGMIVTNGGRWGGYGLYILAGKPVFLYNFMILAKYRWEGPVLSEGAHSIVFDFTYNGPGVGKGATGVLSIDGTVVQTLTIPHTIAFLEISDETFDIGSDLRTGVCDADYVPPFTFNGTIKKVTFNVGPLQFTENDKYNQKHAAVIAYD